MKHAYRLTLPVLTACLLIGAGLTGTAFTQDIDPNVQNQIQELLQEKDSRTAAQQKMSSSLVYALKADRSERLTPSIDAMPDAAGGLNIQDNGVLVDIKGAPSADLEAAITDSGGLVIHGSQTDIHARVPLQQLESLANRNDVSHIKPSAAAKLNNAGRMGPNPLRSFLPRSLAFVISTGSLTSQGMIAHSASIARSTFGVDGTGVKVGVLSDSAEAIPFLIGTGDLPADSMNVADIDQILNGGPGTSEGSAMMEIVHDMAPGAQLFFASAFNGEDSFADNIRLLRNTYHCDVIVDDVSYSDEPAFQDGVIARAVDDVVADGAIYFSSAANSGNLTSGTSGTWEGDFNPNGAAGSPLPAGYTVHNFGGGQNFDRLTSATQDVTVGWSDPLGASTNDYDLFILNAAGTTILSASTTVQSGAGSDPIEEVFRSAGFAANSRILVVAKAGAAQRALHVDTFGATLQLNTSGSTHGHNGGPKTVSVAAVAWNSARPLGIKPFVGGAKNPTETFSSDGPRKMFFNADGTAITPGNFLFGTNGGTTFVKPDIAAADGTVARTPGFSPFFGTSAAAPHAAGIAALAKAWRPGATNTQIYNAMTSTALDIRAVGIDRDSGYGLVMAPQTLSALP